MDFLEKNLEALKERCPEVFKWLNEEKHDDRLERIVSKDGNWNLRIRGKKGKSVFLYDMESPIKEVDKELQNIDFASDKVTFILGFGLGYGAKCILEKMAPGHKVVVLEKNATVLRLAFSSCDFSQPIRDNALIFSLTDNESIRKCAARYAARKLQEDLFYIAYRLREVDEEYEKIEHTLTEAVNSVLVGALTGLRNARRIIINDFNNFSKFLFSAGMNHLHKKFEKIPGIIISAGPSLEKNIHHLKMAKGKAVLFATAPVLRIMLAYDIMPDFVVSIDFLEQNYRHFEGVCHLDIPLIHPCSLYHEIARDYQGPGFVYQDGSGVTGWLKRHWQFKGLNNAGGSVALHAFAVAIVAGCDPIIFVGQDLAFSEKTHAEGAALAQDIDTSENNKGIFWVEGIDGNKVPTNSAFVSYLRRFEEIIGSIENKCIDSTEGGAAIRGTEVMPLKQSIEKYCREETPANSIIDSSWVIETVNYKGIIEDIQRKIKEIGRIQRLVSRGLKTNKEIAGRLKRNKIEDPRTDDVLMKNYRVSTEVQRFCEGFQLTAAFLRKEIFEINRSEYKYESDQPNKKEEIKIGLRRNRMILESSQKVLKEIKVRLKDLLGTATKINKYCQLLNKRGEDPTSFHGYGMLLAEIGLHRLAIREYRKSLQFKETLDVHLDLAKSYVVLEEIKTAEQELERYLECGGEEKIEARLRNRIDKLSTEWCNQARDYYRNGNWINGLLYARKLEKAGLYTDIAGEIISACLEKRDQKICDMETMNDLDLAEKEKADAFQELVEHGKHLMNKHNLEEAIDAFQKAVCECPANQDTVEAESLLACCYSEKREIEKAMEIFHELMKRYPRTGIFHLNSGRAYVRNGLYEQAIREYQAAVEKEERFYFLYFEIGSIYMQKGEYRKAIESFKRYLKYSPDSYELIAKIGTCYLATGMPWKAKEKYIEALEIQPDYETARVGLRKIEEREQDARLKQDACGSQGRSEEHP